MNVFNNVANYLTIAALVFLGAKVGVYSEMIFHWLIFLNFSKIWGYYTLIIYREYMLFSFFGRFVGSNPYEKLVFSYIFYTFAAS